MAGWQDKPEIREEVQKICLKEQEIVRRTLYSQDQNQNDKNNR